MPDLHAVPADTFCVHQSTVPKMDYVVDLGFMVEQGQPGRNGDPEHGAVRGRVRGD